MHSQFSALGEASRWRIVELLAEQPRAVGVLADLVGLRQPQATKHLQALERAGIAEVKRVGQRRIYALRADALGAMSARLTRVAEQAAANRRAFDEYTLTVAAEVLAEDGGREADEREYVFRRRLEASRERVWRYVTEPSLMAEWLSPRDLHVAHLEFAPEAGARLQLVYADADTSRGGQVVSRASGEMHAVSPHHSLEFELSPTLPDGSTAFVGEYSWELGGDDQPIDFEIRLRVSDIASSSAELIAGIGIGWTQCLDRLADAVKPARRAATTREN